MQGRSDRGGLLHWGGSRPTGMSGVASCDDRDPLGWHAVMRAVARALIETARRDAVDPRIWPADPAASDHRGRRRAAVTLERAVTGRNACGCGRESGRQAPPAGIATCVIRRRGWIMTQRRAGDTDRQPSGAGGWHLRAPSWSRPGGGDAASRNACATSGDREPRDPRAREDHGAGDAVSAVGWRLCDPLGAASVGGDDASRNGSGPPRA